MKRPGMRPAVKYNLVEAIQGYPWSERKTWGIINFSKVSLPYLLN